MNQGQELSFRIKLMILGSPGSGKTNILLKNFKSTFEEEYKPTQGSFYVTRDMRYKKETLKIDVIEVGGQSLSAIPSQAFQGVSGIIFAFDINDRQSYKNIPSVIHTASQYVDLKDIVCILAGNKCDLDYAVPEETIDEFSMDINMPFYQTSAKSGEGIEKLFLYLIVQIVEASKDRSSIARKHNKLQNESVSLKQSRAKKFAGAKKNKENGCCSA